MLNRSTSTSINVAVIVPFLWVPILRLLLVGHKSVLLSCESHLRELHLGVNVLYFTDPGKLQNGFNSGFLTWRGVDAELGSSQDPTKC